MVADGAEGGEGGRGWIGLGGVQSRRLCRGGENVGRHGHRWVGSRSKGWGGGTGSASRPTVTAARLYTPIRLAPA